jgi:hypothetical protein
MAAAFLLSGSLDEIALPDVSRLLNATQKTGRLAISSGTAAGSIFFDRGDIVDAQASNLAGLDAVKHLALLNKGGFEFVDGAPAPSRNLATYPTVEIIRLLENRINEALQVQELMPGDREIPKYMGGAIPAGLEVSAAELAVALKSSNGTHTTQQLADELHLDILMVRYTVARFRAAGLMEMAEVGLYTPEPSAPVAEPPPAPPAVPGQPDHKTFVAGTSQTPEPTTSTKPKYWRGRLIG